MEDLEKVVRDYLINRELVDLEFFKVNPDYYEPDPDKLWIVDGGIEFTLSENKFSFGWDANKDFFNIVPDGIEGLTDDTNIVSLEAKNVQGLRNLIGKKIIDLEIKWNFYQELDENIELKEEKKFMPFEIFLFFNDSATLQLSTVNFDLKEGEIINLEYDSMGELLVALNERIEIKTPVSD